MDSKDGDWGPITVTLVPVEGTVDRRLHVRFPGTGQVIRGEPLTQSTIEGFQREPRQRLKALVSELLSNTTNGGESGRSTSASRAQSPCRCQGCTLRSLIRELGEAGAGFLREAFDPESRRTLLDAFRGIRRHRSDDPIFSVAPLADICLVGDVESSLPIEYLFLDWEEFKKSPLSDKSHRTLGPTTVARLAAGFLAFSFNIRRSPTRHGHLPGDPVATGVRTGPDHVLQVPLEPDDRLGVCFYRHEGLESTAAERAFLAGDNDHGVCLKEEDLGEDEDTAVRRLGEMIGAADRFPVHHFACHYEEEDARTDTPAAFRLSSQGRGFKVPLNRILAYEPAAVCDHWVAYLNACHAGSAVSFRNGNLVSKFLHALNAACLIGPDIDVPDAFASQFARVFYAYWLRERDLGLALYKARWFFVLRQPNPVALGLFYVHFAARPIWLAGMGRHVFL